jgi:hypothetical protein
MRLLGFLALVGGLAMALAAEPDMYLLGYEVFVPSKSFERVSGPDRPIMAALRTESQWRTFWDSIEPRMPRDTAQSGPYPLPHIDFGRYTLLVTALGQEPTGGYSIAIDAVRNLGSMIEVSVIALRPGPNCVVTTGRTHPLALALLQRTEKKVKFDVTNAAIACDGAKP